MKPGSMTARMNPAQLTLSMRGAVRAPWNSTPCTRILPLALIPKRGSLTEPAAALQQFHWANVSTDGAFLTAHGPRLFQLSQWCNHNGVRLNYLLNPQYEWDFQRNSSFTIFSTWEHERLRPVDFSALTANRDYTHLVGGAQINTQYFKWINLSMEMDWGTVTNFVPRAGPPVLAYQNTSSVGRGVVPPFPGADD